MYPFIYDAAETVKSITSPFDCLPMLVLQLPLLRSTKIDSFSFGGIIRSPDPIDGQVKWSGYTVCQANADCSDFLSQELCLRLHDEAMVCSHKVIPLDENRLPLSRPFAEEPVLM